MMQIRPTRGIACRHALHSVHARAWPRDRTGGGEGQSIYLAARTPSAKHESPRRNAYRREKL